MFSVAFFFVILKIIKSNSVSTKFGLLRSINQQPLHIIISRLVKERNGKEKRKAVPRSDLSNSWSCNINPELGDATGLFIFTYSRASDKLIPFLNIR